MQDACHLKSVIIWMRDASPLKNLSAVGFEPTRIAPPELESGALDRSAKLSRTQRYWAIDPVKGFLMVSNRAYKGRLANEIPHVFRLIQPFSGKHGLAAIKRLARLLKGISYVYSSSLSCSDIV